MNPAPFVSIRGRLAAQPPGKADVTGRREAAVAVILVPRPLDDLHLLLIKRAERQIDPWSGQMALPGGRRDPADATLLQTAMRETLEETGIVLSESSLLGALADLAPTTPVLPPILVRPFVFGLLEVPPVHPNAEVALTRWVSLSSLPSSEMESEIMVHGLQRTVPGYRIGSDFVWGMTHRIIKPFIELVIS